MPVKVISKDISNTGTGAAQVGQVPWWCPTMTMQGTCVVRTGSVNLPVPAGTWEIQGVTIRVGTAPTTSAILVDVNKNGTTIFGTQSARPTIAAGASGSGLTNTTTGMTVTSLTTGDYLSVDIDQIGSGTAGADLVAVISLRRVS